MVKLFLSIILAVFVTSPVVAEQVTANFIVSFNPITRETVLPKDKDGQPVKMDWGALTKEKGSTIVVQVRAEQSIIDGMKADSKNLWFEDKVAIAPTEAKLGEVVAAVKVNTAAAQSFATKIVPLGDVLKQDWTTSDKAILSLVKLHGGTEAGYKHGLGEKVAVK